MSSIWCHYCNRIARLVLPASGAQLCTSCAGVLVRQDWTELARRQLQYHPDQWVADVAAFIQVSVEAHADEWRALLTLPAPRRREGRRS